MYFPAAGTPARNRAECALYMLLVFVLALAAPAPAPAQVPAPRLDARSWILVDHLTGAVLAEHNADERVEPASLTKIMTVYAVGHALESGLVSLEDEVTVSEKAWRTEGSRMFIEVGKKVSVDDLLQGVIVQSGNDASVALAEHVSGSEDVFSAIMTEHARELGMSGSAFANSTGLPDPGTYTTARDMATLSSALVREFPELYARFSIEEFTFNNIRQTNRNRLLYRDDTVDGVKTGHTEAAGYCLVASADRDGMRLVSAVMGTGSDRARTEASQSLLNFGFRFFETRELYAGGDVVATPRVWRGPVESVEAGPPGPVHVTVPRGRYDELQALAEFDEPILAPVERGRRLGVLRITLDDEPVADVPLEALSDVPEGSFFERVYDDVRLMFE